MLFTSGRYLKSLNILGRFFPGAHHHRGMRVYSARLPRLFPTNPDSAYVQYCVPGLGKLPQEVDLTGSSTRMGDNTKPNSISHGGILIRRFPGGLRQFQNLAQLPMHCPFRLNYVIRCRCARHTQQPHLPAFLRAS